MFKRICLFMIMCTMFMSSGAMSVFAYTITPVDIKELINTFEIESKPKPSAWAIESVDQALELGFVPTQLQMGYTQTITRKEFCTLAVVFYEKMTDSKITERTYFDDTKDLDVEKMGGLGVIAGVGNNKFNPDALLTREQAAVILTNLCETLERPLKASEASFGDKASISTWAVSSVGKIQDAKIMSGVGDNKFSPKGSYTREQSIITIMNVFNYYKK